ncbi:putative gustatory receptor 39b [Zeugodacus cucurbitae]|uniref:putative gustatory receptor 39b n=1 Tax=Zeugodacus cucurbitae TaxID=28588 RepID=UPI0023D93FE6|nr:putative gustatory receptor 39b [Zeugodacus cucurbitae]
MEHELRHWLRLCTFFGIYRGPLKQEFIVTRTTLTLPKNSSSCRRSATRHLLPPQHCYICLIALTLGALYVHGLHYCGSLPTLLLTWVASVVLFSLQVLTNLLILMETVCRRTQHAAFLQLLEQIEDAFKLRLRLNVHKNALLRDLRWLSGCFVVCSLVFWLLFVISTHWLNYIGFFWYGLWSILTMRVRIIQLLLYVRILQHYLECLHAKLRQIVAYQLAPQEQLLDIDYVKLTSVEALLAIKDIYTLIYGAFHLLNSFAGWSLFGIVSCYIFDVSCNIYWTLLSLDGWSNRRYYYMAGPLALLPLLAIVCYLCYICGKCKELARRIAFLLNQLKVMRSKQSLALYRQIVQQISAQIQLQQIEVTAQHFFVLELRLLVTIFSVTSTNFVILVQFLCLEIELEALS